MSITGYGSIPSRGIRFVVSNMFRAGRTSRKGDLILNEREVKQLLHNTQIQNAPISPSKLSTCLQTWYLDTRTTLFLF
jgi:hypothetical protein